MQLIVHATGASSGPPLQESGSRYLDSKRPVAYSSMLDPGSSEGVCHRRPIPPAHRERARSPDEYHRTSVHWGNIVVSLFPGGYSCKLRVPARHACICAGIVGAVRSVSGDASTSFLVPLPAMGWFSHLCHAGFAGPLGRNGALPAADHE